MILTNWFALAFIVILPVHRCSLFTRLVKYKRLFKEDESDHEMASPVVKVKKQTRKPKLKHPPPNSTKDHPLLNSLFGTIPTQNLETLKRLVTDAETPLYRPPGVPSNIILHKRIDKVQWQQANIQRQNEQILQQNERIINLLEDIKAAATREQARTVASSQNVVGEEELRSLFDEQRRLLRDDMMHVCERFFIGPPRGEEEGIVMAGAEGDGGGRGAVPHQQQHLWAWKKNDGTTTPCDKLLPQSFHFSTFTNVYTLWRAWWLGWVFDEQTSLPFKHLFCSCSKQITCLYAIVNKEESKSQNFKTYVSRVKKVMTWIEFLVPDTMALTLETCTVERVNTAWQEVVKVAASVFHNCLHDSQQEEAKAAGRQRTSFDLTRMKLTWWYRRVSDIEKLSKV